jgi:prepilin-type N-terminal cleavage/methylation domain-containing protein
MTAIPITQPVRPAQGFSLIELMISMAVLLAVLGVVMSALIQLERRNSGENDKMDLTQSTREFVDQAVRDLHQTGFPNPSMFNAPTLSPAINNKYIAAGLVSITDNSIQFEGDVDSNGNVQSVTIELVGSDGVTVGGACPCTLKRGKVVKIDGSPFQQPAGAQAVPTYYSELGNVATTSVFSAYDQYGYAVPLPIDLTTAAVATSSPASPVTIKDIRTIKMVVNVQSPHSDLENKVRPIVSMTSEARIYN